MPSERPPTILTLEQVPALRSWARARSLRMVSTNGCFDLIHAAHVRMLARARGRGDLLVVGLNSDASVRRIKGPSRPVVPERDRAEVLAALASVDHVVLFEETLPVRFVELLAPDVHCKSGDYEPDGMPETPAVRAGGGRVEILPLEEGIGTSELIGRICASSTDAGRAPDTAPSGASAVEVLLGTASDFRQVAYRLAGPIEAEARALAALAARARPEAANEAVGRLEVEPRFASCIREALLRLAEAMESESEEPHARD